jgi:UDP-glucose 4-epimerase
VSGDKIRTTSQAVEAMTSASEESKYFIAGGAGFIGSHLSNRLVELGTVTVYDSLSSGRLEFIEHHRDRSNFCFIKSDLLELDTLKKVVGGHE